MSQGEEIIKARIQELIDRSHGALSWPMMDFWVDMAIRQKGESLAKSFINDMSLEELSTVRQIVRNVNYAVHTYPDVSAAKVQEEIEAPKKPVGRRKRKA